MDFLNKAMAQVADLFRSMTPGARITTGLLLVVLVVSLGYLFRYRQSSPDLYLMGGEHFPASQLPAMQAAFAKAGLNSYELEGTRVRIPHGQQNLYMVALVENNALPENYSEILDKALDTNPWLDREAQEKRFKAARERQLALIIRSMQGVQNAFVMYDSETKRGFNRENIVTASVNVSCKAGAQLADGQVLAIRSLVSRSIAGLRPENVAVTDLGTGRTLTGSGENGGGVLDDPHLQRKHMYEQQWVEKAHKALWYVPGATITANVELERELRHRRETVKHDPKTVPLQISEKSQTSTSESGGPGGRTGYVAQQPNTPLSLGAASKTRQEQEQSESQTLNVTGGERDTVEMAGLTPKRVTMSIGVPNSYFVKVWQERNPAGAGAPPKTPDNTALEQIRTDEITKIRQHVANILLPVEGLADLSQLVQVTSFQDLVAPEPALPTTLENTLVWLTNNWSTLGVAVLALMALMMLRSMVRGLPEAASSAAGSPVRMARGPAGAAEPEEEQEAIAAKAENQQRLRRFTGSGPSLRDELAQLVQEDPDAAANVLRAWIGMGVPK